MECFRVCYKKWTANSNTGFFVLFCVFFFAPCIWQALFFSVGSCSYQLNSQSSTNILLAASEMFTSITSSWTSVSHCTTTTEPVLNVKQWATRAHINLAGEARVLTYLVLTGVTVPLGLMEVAVKQVFNFFLRICNVLRTYYSLKRLEEYGIFWNLFKCLVSKMQTTVHELCMIKDTLWAFKCMRFLVMRNVSSSLSDLVDLQLINART